MKPQLIELSGHFAQAGVITPQDILTLRRSVWADGSIDAAEADAIFTMNDLMGPPTPEWSAFFVEAISTWLVDQADPRGVIDETQAAWLIARIGGAPSRDEIELVVHCLEKAHSAPPSVAQFALAHVEAAVLPQDGARAQISARDVALLRRLVFAPGSEHPGSVGRPAAEMLCRLKDAALGANNVAEWQDLFVMGIGNYLQGFSGPEPLSREREAELADFINRPAAGIGSFFERMANQRSPAIESETPQVVKSANWFGKKARGPGVRPGTVVNFSANKPLVFDPNMHKRTAKPIADARQAWLDRLIQTDDQIDPLERALLHSLKAA